MGAYRTYVGCIALEPRGGDPIPLALLWEDGRAFRIGSCSRRTWASDGLGQMASRYDVVVHGHARQLWHDEAGWYLVVPAPAHDEAGQERKRHSPRSLEEAAVEARVARALRADDPDELAKTACALWMMDVYGELLDPEGDG